MHRNAVVVFRTGQLGDSLIALPALAAIRRLHRGCRIILITETNLGKKWVFAGDVLLGFGCVDEVISYPARAGVLTKLRYILSARRKLRRADVRAVYSLSHIRGPLRLLRDRALLSFVAHCRTYHEAPRPVTNGLPGANAEWQRLLRAVPTGEPPEVPLLRVLPQDMADARTLMKRKGVPDRAIFVFGPGTKMSSKKWPIERYELLLTRLAAEHADAAFVVLGGPEDVDDGERLRAILPHRCYNLAGATSIGESAAVLSLAHLYIGNDTGTMHLAAAVGTKCIAIFSARDVANKWAPFGAGHQVIRKEVPCAGCLLENCVEMRGLCLTLISVDEVFERTNAALKDANDRVAEDPQ